MLYTARIYKDEDGYSVEFPDLGDTFTFGATLEEAKANAEEALECTLRSLLDERRPWPAAKTRPNAAKGLYAIPVSPLVECAQGIVKALGKRLEINLV